MVSSSMSNAKGMALQGVCVVHTVVDSLTLQHPMFDQSTSHLPHISHTHTIKGCTVPTCVVGQDA
mgnify:CR=1 FL=1